MHVVDRHLLVPVHGNPGLFVVLRSEAADLIAKGHMRLVAHKQQVLVETITRARRPVETVDPYARLVFVAVDQAGKLALDLPG